MGQDGQNNGIGATSGTPPATSIQDFEIIKSLGQGTFATVYLAKRLLNNQLYALKIIKKQLVLQSNELEHTNAELKILSQLKHPFLMNLHGAFQNADNLYLVLDFLSGGELFHHLQKQRYFSEKTAQFIVAELVLALNELHKRQIIMRDLKPENILMDKDGYIKLTDFGLSKLSKTGGNVVGTTFCGTAEYLSPEQLRNQPHGVEVDYWSLGVICYELIAGIPPFYNRDHKTMFKNILRNEPKFSERFSQNCMLFVKQCLEKDPKKRLGSGGNIEAIKTHPWFAKLDWEKLYNRQYEMEYKPDKHLNKDNVDLSNFDTRFTNQPINLQDIISLDNTDIQNQQLFEGFEVDSKLAKNILDEKVKNAEKQQNQQIVQLQGQQSNEVEVEENTNDDDDQKQREVSQKRSDLKKVVKKPKKQKNVDSDDECVE